MKKMFSICLSVIIAFTFSTAVFAQESFKVKGTVTKIDMPAKSVTIQPKEGEPVMVVMEDEDLLYKVKEGEKGQATYTVKDGRNIGSKLKKLTEGCQ